MFYWLIAFLFITIGIPVIAFVATIIFCALHLFGVISCSWWWLTIPIVIMLLGLFFDLKTSYSSPSK